jgi:hypothetical protein
MMSPTIYCCEVQTLLRALRSEITDAQLDDWFADTGRASSAVTLAVEGCSDQALRIAERLARKWNLKVG